MVSDGTFSNGDRNTYAPLVADWLTKDWFMTLADFTAYSSIQSEIEALYRDPLEWNRKAVPQRRELGLLQLRQVDPGLSRQHLAHLPVGLITERPRRCSSVAVPLYSFLRCA